MYIKATMKTYSWVVAFPVFHIPRNGRIKIRARAKHKFLKSTGWSKSTLIMQTAKKKEEVKLDEH